MTRDLARHVLCFHEEFSRKSKDLFCGISVCVYVD
jgi:hypothetical protein